MVLFNESLLEGTILTFKAFLQYYMHITIISLLEYAPHNLRAQPLNMTKVKLSWTRAPKLPPTLKVFFTIQWLNLGTGHSVEKFVALKSGEMNKTFTIDNDQNSDSVRLYGGRRYKFKVCTFMTDGSAMRQCMSRSLTMPESRPSSGPQISSIKYEGNLVSV